MPIYGFGAGDCERGHLRRLARVLRILRTLDGFAFDTFLDVGGAEGFLAAQVQRLFSARAASSDLSLQACLRARELFGVPSGAVLASRLPFADASFDVVVCSEVLEHVDDPVTAVLELQRVAKKVVVMTTEELHYDREFIDEYLFRRPGWPHMERNLLHPDDVAALFPGAEQFPQCDTAPPGDDATKAEAGRWLLANTRAAVLEPGRIGVIVVQRLGAATTQPRRHSDEQFVDALLAPCAVPGAPPPPPTGPAAWFVDRLRDPHDGAAFRCLNGALVSATGRTVPLLDGVPDLVPATDPAEPTRVLLERRLRAAPAQRRADLLALHDRLDLPDHVAQDRFDFARRDDRRGFFANEQLQPRGDRAAFSWRSTGADPWLVTPCLQRRIRAIELDLRIHAPDVPVASGTGQVYWKGPLDATFAEDRCLSFAVPNDGAFHTHRLELDGHPRWSEVIQWLRIDPVDGACEVDLAGLRLY